MKLNLFQKFILKLQIFHSSYSFTKTFARVCGTVRVKRGLDLVFHTSGSSESTDEKQEHQTGSSLIR